MPELSLPTLSAYESCDGGGTFFEHQGTTPRLSLEEIDSIREQGSLDDDWIEGVWSVGTGLCCQDPRYLCVSMTVDEELDLSDLAAEFAARYEGNDACFGIAVFVDGPPSLD